MSTQGPETNYPYLDSLGWGTIVEYVQAATSLRLSDAKSCKTWVSIGSGTGEVEYNLAKELDGTETKIICVDPAPESRRRFPKNGNFVAPEYDTAESLTKERKDLINECGMLLVWPEPAGKKDGDDSNYLTYDVDAIRLLNPKVVLLIYETFGGSGSEVMHAWLDCFHPDKPKNFFQKQFSESASYGLLEKAFPTSKYQVKAFRVVQKMSENALFRDVARHEMCLLLRSDVSSDAGDDARVLEKLTQGIDDLTNGEQDGCFIC
jgi:hypothetical protein